MQHQYELKTVRAHYQHNGHRVRTLVGNIINCEELWWWRRPKVAQKLPRRQIFGPNSTNSSRMWPNNGQIMVDCFGGVQTGTKVDSSHPNSAKLGKFWPAVQSSTCAGRNFPDRHGQHRSHWGKHRPRPLGRTLRSLLCHNLRNLTPIKADVWGS